MTNDFMRVVDGLVLIRRCTEALTPDRQAFANYTNPTGRCVAVEGSKDRLLMDRRMARRVAEAILEVCGPDEDLPTDDTRCLVAVTAENGLVSGFAPVEG